MQRFTFLLRLLALFAFSAATAVQADQTTETSPADLVSYDKLTDHMNVMVEASSLKLVLARLAKQSSIEVLFDDAADEEISVDVQSNSLDEGLKHILKGRNHIMRYSKDSNGKLLLVGVLVLPVGEQDSGRAKRLLGMENEAYSRVRSEITLEQAQQMDAATERWQARLGELPTERREALIKSAEERFLKKVVREKNREERRKKINEERTAKTAKRRERREESLKHLDAEQRAAYEQKAAAAKESVRLMLQD